MRDEIERLIGTRIDDLVKLELALFFHQHPSFVDRLEGIARRVGRDPRVVEDALRGLAEGGLLERFELGSGKYVLYSYTRDPDMRGLIDVLSDAYHENPAERIQIVKRLMGLAR
jgi:hypothetical protein